MKKGFMITLILLICSATIAQELDNDIIQVNYEKKSLAKAMLLSSLFPGAGQFYANRRSITTYIFPLIEIGLIAGYYINYKEGLDKEAAYEYYANGEIIDYIDDEPVYRYDRNHQADVQRSTIIIDNTDIYTNDHFRLDGIDLNEDEVTYTIWENNTQHFYEDIGKYDKYIFGWDDWYNNYIISGDPEYLNDWINQIHTESNLRSEYIKMRQNAENSYDKAEMFSFGLVANHILAAIDAVRLTKIHNRGYLSNTTKLEIKFAPVFVNNNFSPALMVTKRF